MFENTNLSPLVRIAISVEGGSRGSMFGRGVADLCLGVREKGSLNAAAKDMHMAYSKAWRIMKDTESTLSIRLLDRDGAHGSTLTPEGDALLDSYLEIDRDLNEYALKLFAQKFKA